MLARAYPFVECAPGRARDVLTRIKRLREIQALIS